MNSKGIRQGPVTAQTIQDMAQRIKDGLAGTRIFLFGSYAWGRPNKLSDVDFAVVVDDARHPLSSQDIRDTPLSAMHLSNHGPIGLDVLAYRASTFQSLEQGSLAFEIRTRGIEL